MLYDSRGCVVQIGFIGLALLLDGAPIPAQGQLPADLKPLVRRHAEFVEHRTVDANVERLIRKLKLVHENVPPPMLAAPPTNVVFQGATTLLFDQGDASRQRGRCSGIVYPG